MLDPNLVLMGTSKYEWRPEDMTEAAFDDRINDILAIDFGFDFGPLSLQVFPAVLSQAAVRMGEVFDRSADLNLWRAGPRLTFRNWQVELLGGFADLTGDSGCRRRQGCTSVQARRVFQAQEEAVLGWPGHVTHGSLAPAQIPTPLNLRLHGSPRRCTLSYSYNEA